MNPESNMNSKAAGLLIAIVLLVVAGVYFSFKSGPVSPAGSTVSSGTTSNSPSNPVGTQPGSNIPTNIAAPNASTTVIVTNAANGKVVHVKQGGRFMIELGTGLTWTLSIGTDALSAQIISRVKNIALINGAQGLFDAKFPGSVVISAQGAPICKTGQACPQFLAVFSTTITIDK